jgi:hypothetical protein
MWMALDDTEKPVSFIYLYWGGGARISSLISTTKYIYIYIWCQNPDNDNVNLDEIRMIF